MIHFKRKLSESAQGERRSKLGLKAVSLTLCATLGLGVAACSNGGGNENGGSGGNTATGAYFSAKELDFYKAKENDSVSVNSMTMLKDKIAVLVSVYVFPTEGGGGESGGGSVPPGAVNEVEGTQAIAASNTKNSPKVDLLSAEESAPAVSETTEEGATAPVSEPAGEGTQAAVPIKEGLDESAGSEQTDKIYFYDFDGKLTSEVDLKSILPAGRGVQSLTADSEGNLFLLISPDYSQMTEAKAEPTEQKYGLLKIDSEGKKLGEPIDITMPVDFWPSRILVDKQENIYFLSYGAVYVTDKQGKKLTSVKIKEEMNSQNLVMVGDKIYIDGVTYSETGSTYEFFEITPNQKELGTGIKIDGIATSGMSTLSSGPDGVYQVTNSGIYKYNLESNKKTTILLWNDSDIERSSNGMEQAFVLSDDKVFFFTQKVVDGNNFGMGEPVLMLLNREKENPNANKKIITLGGLYLGYDSSINKAVYNFNKNSTDYRVIIKDYNDTPEASIDSTKATTQMNLEMMAGNGPDILYTNEAGLLNNYIGKNLLVDLNTLIEKDGSFKKEDYLDAIMKLSERDDKLYYMIPSFMVSGLGGAKSVIGDRKGWTVEEFEKIATSLPANMKMLAQYSQSQLFIGSLFMGLNDYIDVNTSKAKFDNESFYQLLDFAKKYGTPDEQLNKEGGMMMEDPYEKIKNKEVALTDAYIAGASAYNQLVALFGEPVSVVGLPSPSQQGPGCVPSTMLSIASGSKQQEGAWEFYKYFMSEENLASSNGMGMGQIPALKSLFEKDIELAKHPETVDPNSPVVYNFYYDGSEPKPMTDEIEAAYRSLIDNLGQIPTYDMELYNMVSEEVTPFFAGDKTAQSVAQTLQNRVQTLLNERK